MSRRMPPTTEEQIKELWLAVYNHLPAQIKLLSMKTNFILAFMGLVLALMAILIVLAVS